MSLRTPALRIAPALILSALLGACAVEPPKPPPRPATVIARPPPPPSQIEPIRKTTVDAEPWTRITADFVMQDCGASPLIQSNAAMYTRGPRHFEQRVRQSLPLLLYVEKQLRAAGIPGEFALLPMLESSYQPGVSNPRGTSVGMWQFVSATARHHGIAINHEYDGRRDPVASTHAAITMLKALHRQFGDWRLVDMAFNSGAYGIAAALRRHPDLGSGPIPSLPVSAGTRDHLARLMALACILRNPQRYQVRLPEPTPNDELVAVAVPAGTGLQAAADMAGWPESSLRALNAGYRGARIPANSPRTLLLPAVAADRLASALVVDGSDAVAQVNEPANAGNGDDPAMPVEPRAPMQDAGGTGAPGLQATRHHRVDAGETLWSIAQRYHVSVNALKRWNHLDGSELHTGERLQVSRNF
ncbi:MAG TPA: transglycosylase SLT domain-containing protein [Rhodanobacteraceae bacterium]|nr:transglycosylase SLT domain-containing protein [Rhodanobacteraceae bacterium]